ncbi:Ig-like domain-containing protein [Paeniglutamicibacter sulfureus]|uniref:Ig-like domain-containing protein n=1 Tax=Paeniglutamicibacter sulfureus TaxID=43666 RepID=UPI0026657BBF|nr:Ig-like domain-containing protein [Paeniglutamicibacter sulfureus]MDO2935640.1 Ig-like domain-containing protein [Paeniglutamicibacter sulfureus]
MFQKTRTIRTGKRDLKITRSSVLAGAASAAMLAAALVPLAGTAASANTAGNGPVDPQNGFPTWFSDGTAKLQLCYTAGTGCLMEPPNPDLPASYPDNFPDEAFWFAAEASGGNLRLYEAALEAAHANEIVQDGDQMGFGRLRFIIENIVAGQQYTVTHPYGVNTFTAEADPKVGGRIKVTLDSGACAPSLASPCNWGQVGAAFLGDYTTGSTATFLRQVGAAPGTLGDINTARAVTGAPSGNNFVTVTGPNAGGPGIDTLTVSTFTVQGLLYQGDDGAPSTPDLAAASDTGRSTTDNITRTNLPTLTGTATAGSTVELMVDGATVPAVSGVATGGNYSLRVPTALANGVHKFQARIANPLVATDPAAPPYLTSPTLTATVDTVAPVSSVVAPFPSTPTLDNTPTLNTAVNEARSTLECRLLPSNPDWEAGCPAAKTYDAQVNGTYVFEVRASDAAGNTGAVATRTVRIGPADTVAPAISSRGPGTNATNVNTASNVSAVFSEFVQGVSATTFTLKNPAGTTIPAAVTYDQATRRATLNPTANLALNTVYTARITGGASAVRDLAGIALPTTTWTFTTNAAPTVTVRTPASGAKSVAVAGNVSTTFSEPVTGVGATTFTLKNAATGAAIPSAVSYNATTRVATLNPTANLAADTRYTAVLTGGTTAIRDAQGAPLATHSWTFTTGPAPVVSARVPAVNATAIRRANNITVTFSEAVLGVGTTTLNLRNATTGAVVSATVTRNGTTNQWILNPAASLAANTRYTVRVTGGTTAIRDAAINPLVSTSWSFTTGAS